MLKGEEDLYFDWKYAMPIPREAPPTGYGLTSKEWFHDELEKRTKGHIKIEEFYGGQLGGFREMPDLLGQGVFETAFCPKGEMLPDRFPYSAIVFMPFWMPDDLEMAAKLFQYCWSHPLFLENFAKANLMYGYTFGGLKMRQFLAKGVPKITKVDDLAGLQHRAYGYDAIWTESLGMVPVGLSGAEVYEGLQKGIIDSSVNSMAEIEWKNLYEVIGSIIDVTMFIRGGTIGDVNLDAWNSLPQYIKDIWRELVPEATSYQSEIAEILERDGLAFAKEKGLVMYKLDPEEESKYKAAGLPVWEKWVEDSEGLPNGNKIRDYIRDCIAFRDTLTGEPWTMYIP